ncbi:MAG: Ig-like domain-containing protein [Oscillochloridaceae bacterium umkhey_bin13]
MNYYARLAAFSLSIAALTLLLLLIGPQANPLSLIAQTPTGEQAAPGAAIRVTFNRPVDRASTEASFQITPPIAGNFFWEERTLSFVPAHVLQASTSYTVRFGPELRDAEGRPATDELSWSFQTRAPRLLVLRETPTGGSELWLAELAGGARQLLNSAEGISEIAVSPDGNQVVYVEWRSNLRSVLMLLDLTSGAIQTLFDDPEASAAAPAWSPSGDMIAYERQTLSAGGLGAPRLWLAQPDGTLLGPLVSGPEDRIARAPAWSPDGNRLAFLDAANEAVQVYSFFSDTVTTLPASSREAPAWLPDGSALVYCEPIAGGPQLRLALVTLGSEPVSRPLTDGNSEDAWLAVAPNGGAVAFHRREPTATSYGSHLWLVAILTGPAQPLTSSGPHQDVWPNWSPDGQQLAFIRVPEGQGASGAWAMRIDLNSRIETPVLDRAIYVAWAP